MEEKLVENQESQQHFFKARGAFITSLVVIVSMVSGAFGGVAGTIYLTRKPEFQKLLSLGQGALNQKVTVLEDNAVIDVVKKSGPAVVSIVISKDLNKLPGYGANPFGNDPFFNFFGIPTTPKSNTPNIQEVGAGSGFLVSKEGLILSNKHVVEDEQASYTVIMNDGKTYDAQVLARDPNSDLAILKIDIQNAPILELANSDELQVGQRVIAIGNSLGQYQNTVTSGIISGIGRKITAGGGGTTESLEGVIQTDAAINPGNSGGPLLNSAGQVIGINTAIDREGQLVGFALPSNDAARSLDSYKKNGKITRPYLGIRYVMINKAISSSQKLPRDHGALITRGNTMEELAVIPGSPADKAGLVENDIILSVNGKNVDENHSLVSLLKNHRVGDTIELNVFHKDGEKKVKVTLEESK